MPVDDRAGGTVGDLVRRVLRVDDPQFALEVAEPELEVRRVIDESGTAKYGSIPSSSVYHSRAACMSAA